MFSNIKYMSIYSTFKYIRVAYTLHKTVRFSVVLHVCETGSLTLREERKLYIFENTILRQILQFKRDEDFTMRKSIVQTVNLI